MPIIHILAATLLLGPTPAPRSQDTPPAAVKQALEKQQGTWLAFSSRRDGNDADPEIVRTIERVVKDDKAVWSRDGKRFAGSSIVLDPTTDPASIDVIPDGGPHRDQHVLGIYKLDGDQLSICMADAGKPRPKSFSAEAGETQTLQTFKRKPDANPNPNPNQAR